MQDAEIVGYVPAYQVIPDRLQRLKTIQSLASDLPQHLTPWLRCSFADPDPSVRYWLIVAAAHIADPCFVPDLIAVINGDDPHLRNRAALALGAIRSPRAIPTLINMLTMPAVEDQEVAVIALGQIGALRAVAPLRALYPTAAQPLRSAIAQALDAIQRGSSQHAVSLALSTPAITR